MTPEEYKKLSVKEFTQAAKIYDSGHAGIYEMCKDDYPPILAELEKRAFLRCSGLWMWNWPDDRTSS